MENSNLGRKKASQRDSVIFGFGLGNKTLKDIGDWVVQKRIRFAVDVRSEEKQEKNKRFTPEKISGLFSDLGVDYRDFSQALGDRSDYRLHMLSKSFVDSLDDITKLTDRGKVAIFCSEKDFRKCHRKMIASQLSRRGFRVQHSIVDLETKPSSQMTLEEVERELTHPKRRLFTIGYAKKSMREFSEQLRACRIERLVDIRLRPVSQYAGYARQDDLDFLLELLGIEYVHLPALAPDGSLLDKYRKDGNWEYYERRFAEILEERDASVIIGKILEHKSNVCLLCSEDIPLKCHRRLVAELAKRVFPSLEILHITSRGVEKERHSIQSFS
jgi:uncharacterized protein (DUF488 family)